MKKPNFQRLIQEDTELSLYNYSLFNNFMDGFDQKMQAMLALQFTRQQMLEDFRKSTERAKLKEELKQEILSAISITIEDEAIRQLRDMLNEIGD